MRIDVIDHEADTYGTTVPVGTRYRVPAQDGVTVFEYVGEAYFDYSEPNLDGDYDWQIVASDDSEIYGDLAEFVATHNPHYGYPTLSDAGIDGVRFDYINGGVALQMTSDEEGAYVFRFWGEDA